MHLVLSITVGDVLVVVSVVSSFWGLTMRFADRLARIEERVELLWLAYQRDREARDLRRV